jgi:hypothetical protein
LFAIHLSLKGGSRRIAFDISSQSVSLLAILRNTSTQQLSHLGLQGFIDVAVAGFVVLFHASPSHSIGRDVAPGCPRAPPKGNALAGAAVAIPGAAKAAALTTFFRSMTAIGRSAQSAKVRFLGHDRLQRVASR